MADRVLVTGASGFLAKHCTAELLRQGYDVRGSLRTPERAAEVRAAVAADDPGDRLDFAMLDLEGDAGWDEAMAGCRYLMHVASPFPLAVPADRDALVGPAREGTLRALRAASRAGIARTVLTSSLAAVYNGHDHPAGHAYTEADWSDVDSPLTQPYPRSKTLAERAAWDFVAQDRSGMALAVINPSLILGPAPDRQIGSSAEVIRLYLTGKYPAVPRIEMHVVDVRDVAAMHVAALSAPEAAGERFLCSSGPLWLREISQVLAAEFPQFRRKLPMRQLPDWLVRLAGRFDRTLRNVVPDLGRSRPVSTEKAQACFGLTMRPPQEAVVAAAQSLIDHGVVRPPA
jgi:dihydroflavonol-4-reductase